MSKITDLLLDTMRRAEGDDTAGMDANIRKLRERHLETCPGCSEYLAQLRALAGGLGGLDDAALPAAARDALTAEYRRRP